MAATSYASDNFQRIKGANLLAFAFPKVLSERKCKSLSPGSGVLPFWAGRGGQVLVARGGGEARLRGLEVERGEERRGVEGLFWHVVGGEGRKKGLCRGCFDGLLLKRRRAWYWVGELLF